MKTDNVVGIYIFRRPEKELFLFHNIKYMLWMSPGGHIDPRETPDEAVIREAKEETNLTIKLLNYSSLPVIGNMVRRNAIPFDVHTHSVGDHHHHCPFYICEAINPQTLKLNEEADEYDWFNRESVKTDKRITTEVKNLAELAFITFEKAIT